MKKSKVILKILLTIVLLFLLGTSVQAADFGIYTQEDGCITRILPGTTIADFKSNLSTEENIVIKNAKGEIVENSDIVKTGMTLEIGGEQYKLSVVGDINGDGKITITDVVKCKLDSVNIKKLEGEQAKSADINGDGKKSITDLVQLSLVQVNIKDITEYVKYPIIEESNLIYATLYNDGTLTFTSTDKAIEGKTVVEKYGDISKKKFGDSRIPWNNDSDKITSVDIVDKIQPRTMQYWFYGLTNLQMIKNIHNLDTSNVTDMHAMFKACGALTSLDLSGFDTSNVTDMHAMFRGCRALTSLDLSSFDTSNVNDMHDMFYECSGLTSLNLSSLDTSNVTDMSHMFDSCTALTSLDLSNFDTSSVTTMYRMFCACSGLASLNLSSLDTSNVADMSDMFYGCSALTSLDLSSFDTKKAYMYKMFAMCKNLTVIYVGPNWVSTEDIFDKTGTDHVTVKNNTTRASLNERINKLGMLVKKFI